MTRRSAQYALGGNAVAGAFVPRKAATSWRSSRLIGYATVIIAPKSRARRMRAAGIWLSDVRGGIRGLVCSWQKAHRCLYTASPGDLGGAVCPHASTAANSPVVP